MVRQTFWAWSLGGVAFRERARFGIALAMLIASIIFPLE
jgi:hypothetical protein